jgi:enoyl-CoA hydratase/carnithine racemase
MARRPRRLTAGWCSGSSPPRLEALALLLARRLAGLEPALVHAARRAIRAAHDLDLASGIALERRLGVALQRRA